MDPFKLAFGNIRLAVDYWRHPVTWDSDNGQFVGHMTDHVSWMLGIILLWPHLATTVKRLHDRGRSGWFVLIALIPIIGVVWLWIETWFLPGTPGPNAYGSGPMRT